MKKVKVNAEACIGCGACVAIDPEHFDFNDNGLSEAVKQDNLETEELQNAVESCPTAAIVTFNEDSECCTCENCDCDDCDCDDGDCDDCDCDDCCCNEDCHCESHEN